MGAIKKTRLEAIVQPYFNFLCYFFKASFGSVASTTNYWNFFNRSVPRVIKI